MLEFIKQHYLITLMKNKVELLGYYGSDEIIACSAWTSTNRNLTPEKRERIPNLIKMLWREGHESPFEKTTLHFLVDTDIATHIHLIKHRIASINAESARYKELKEDKFYLPEDWKGIAQSKYEGKYASSYHTWYEVLENFTKASNALYHECLNDLTPVLGRKRAQESARFFKTYNSQIQADVMFNLRSFANFQKLRNSEHAQVEIREVAKEMLALMESIEGNPFKYTLEAWREDNTIP
jgi:flavin-dependent thymidylate synthase